MQSVSITLPASSTLQWCPWVKVSDDSLFNYLFDKVTFALDFYDEQGNFVMRIDSVELNDSTFKVESTLREVSIDLDSSMLGHLVFHRIDGMFDAAGIPNNIITTTRLSTSMAAKRARRYTTSGGAPITLGIEPNPARDHVSVIFELPVTGVANAQLYDQLGRVVKQVFDDRVFSRGEHNIRINTADLQEGVYILQFRYGNYALTERVIIIR